MATTITAAELAEGNRQYSDMMRELEAAKVRAADAVSEAVQRWNSPLAQEYAHSTAATVRSLTARANSLAAFLRTADVIDPEPEPDPPVPAARPVGIIQRDPRVVTARMHGCCRHCSKGIKPGDRIVRTFCAGTWSHAECFQRDLIARKAASDDRKLAACFLSFFDRLPVAA